MTIIPLGDRDMYGFIGIEFRKDNTFLVFTEHFYMGWIDIIGTMTSYKAIILAKFLQSLHRATQNIVSDLSVLCVENIHIILFRCDV